MATPRLISAQRGKYRDHWPKMALDAGVVRLRSSYSDGRGDSVGFITRTDGRRGVMLHSDRVWCVAEVASAEELTGSLAETTWCCCQAFKVSGHPRYIWMNDSTSPDGAQEYAVCRFGLAEGDIRQLESITFGWCDIDKAIQFIRQTLNGEDDGNEWGRNVNATIQTPREHGCCGFCD